MVDTKEMLREFHEVLAPPSGSWKDLRPILHEEEHRELLEALAEGDREHIARELADVVYVAYGTARVWGIDLDKALEEIHRANMSKLGEDGRPVIREDGKVLKGPRYVAPDMGGCLL